MMGRRLKTSLLTTAPLLKSQPLLVKACQQHDMDFIDHKNIQHKHLNAYGLHLNRSGTGEMAKNFITYLNSKYD